MDASVIPYMLESDPSLRNAQDVIDILNKESGVLGVSELSSDMRDLSEAVAKEILKRFLPMKCTLTVSKNLLLNILAY